jgi:hypothetical protein
VVIKRFASHIVILKKVIKLKKALKMFLLKILKILGIYTELPVVLPPPRISHRKDCMLLLVAMDPAYFFHYDAMNGMSLTVKPMFTNIELYTKKLSEVAKLMEQEKPVPVSWVQPTDKEVSVDRFLTTENGHYMDVRLGLSQFRDNAIKVCTLLEKSDYEDFGIHEHNLRMLLKLLINLKELIVEINKTLPMQYNDA